jgi:hypothetical protein
VNIDGQGNFLAAADRQDEMKLFFFRELFGTVDLINVDPMGGCQ